MRMNNAKVVAYLLIVFFLLGLLCVAYLGSILPPFALLIIGSWTPNISALVVLGLIFRDKSAVRSLLARWTMVRVPFSSYLLALLFVPIVLLAIGVYSAVYRSPLQLESLAWGRIALSIPIVLVTGAMGEELGWRGLMLTELRKSYSLLGSGALIGLAWTAFHVPLWFVPELGYASVIPFPAFFVSTMALSVGMAYLVEISQGSLFIATLAHFLQSFCLGFIPDLAVPADPTFYFYAGLNVVFAGALVLRYGWREAPRIGAM